MDEFAKALAAMSWPKPREIEYRIYYDPESGQILNYTNDDLPGNYIIVDKETFAKHRFDVKVKQGRLVSLLPTIGRLVPSDDGISCHPEDITLVVDASQPHIKWKFQHEKD